MGIYDLFSMERIHHQQAVNWRSKREKLGVWAKSKTQAVVQIRPKTPIDTSFRKGRLRKILTSQNMIAVQCRSCHVARTLSH